MLQNVADITMLVRSMKKSHASSQHNYAGKTLGADAAMPTEALLANVIWGGGVAMLAEELLILSHLRNQQTILTIAMQPRNQGESLSIQGFIAHNQNLEAHKQIGS